MQAPAFTDSIFSLVHSYHSQHLCSVNAFSSFGQLISHNYIHSQVFLLFPEIQNINQTFWWSFILEQQSQTKCDLAQQSCCEEYLCCKGIGLSCKEQGLGNPEWTPLRSVSYNLQLKTWRYKKDMKIQKEERRISVLDHNSCLSFYPYISWLFLTNWPVRRQERCKLHTCI